jgi:hypothetical protein
LTSCTGVAEAAVVLVPSAADAPDAADPEALASVLFDLPQGEGILAGVEREVVPFPDTAHQAPGGGAA